MIELFIDILTTFNSKKRETIIKEGKRKKTPGTDSLNMELYK
jgi:hypothetical protein